MRIFIALGGLLVMLLLAVLIAPYFVDWTAFRDEFEREAGRILGRAVTVEGSASARLLPFPSLTFEDVVVAGEGGRPLMTLASFSMDAELAPYLSGEIRIFQMRLESPHLTVPLSSEPSPEGAPSAVAGLPDSTVILEKVDVADGRITFLDEGGSPRHEIADIQASLSARTLSGPFGGGGRMVANGEPLSFTLTSGEIAADGTWPLRLGLSSERLAAAFTFDGTTKLGDGAADFTGALQIVSPASGEVPDRPLPPVRVTSTIDISETQADLSEARVEVGEVDEPYVLSGSGRVTFAPEPRYELDLSGEQVDVDRIAGGEEGEGAILGFADRLEAVRSTLAAIPDLGIAGEVHMRLPVVTAGDTTIRNSEFTGSPGEGGWSIRQLSAELPGRTLFEASGDLSVGEALGFSGDLLVASRQVGGFANWLSGRVEPELAPLRRAGFAATVELSPGRQVLESLEIDVGGERLFGRLDRISEGDERSIGADLSGQAVDLDAFLAFARLFDVEAGRARPADSFDIRFDAGPVTYQGVTTGNLTADFAYANSLLDLRSLLVTDLAGATIDARGTVAGLPGEPRPELALDLSADDPSGILRLLDERLPESPVIGVLRDRASQLGPLRLSGTAAQPIEDGAPALTVDFDGASAGTDISFSLSLQNGLAAATRDGRFGLKASVSNADPMILAGQFGLQGFDLGAPAPLSVTLDLAGEVGEPVATNLQLTAPGSELGATGIVELSAAGLDSADLDWRARSDDVSPWLAISGLALGQGFEAVPVDLAASLSWFGGDWALSEIAGDVAGSRIAADLRATADGGVGGEASLSSLSLPWLATLAYGSDPSATGSAGWPETPFGATLLNSRPIAIDLSADRVLAGDMPELTDISARITAGEGTIEATDIAGRFAGGEIAGRLAFRNNGGLGSLAAALDLRSAQIAEAAEEGAVDPVSGVFGGSIGAEGSGRTYAELVRSMTGSGEISLSEATIGGVAANIFPELLQRTSGDDFAISSDSVSQIVRTLVAGRAYPVESFSAPVELALGEIRLAPSAIAKIESSEISGGGTLDLSDRIFEATIVQRFVPGEDERIADTEPAVTYRLNEMPGGAFELANVEPLTGYLTARRLQREEERLEAIREDLRETLRLRREARYFAWRVAERERLAAERAEAERLRVEEEARARAAEGEARRQAEERVRAEAEAARQEEAARRAAEAARPAPAPPASSPPQLDFDLSPPASAAPSPEVQGPTRDGYQGLPGVSPPLDF